MTCRFRLPNIEELTKQQERVRLLPPDGCYLVVGGPGTGKSVIALLRALRHQRQRSPDEQGPPKYVFLVYNRLLLEASRDLAGEPIHAQTWKSWFPDLYRQMLKRSCPLGPSGKPWDLDWHAIEQGVAAAGPAPDSTPHYLIIDEGQDMPPAFYHALAGMGFENYFVVADQNQQISDENSNLRDIANALDISAENRIELTDNYRNSYNVARLARAFCPHDPASPPPDLPATRRSVRLPLLVDYGSECRLDFDGVIGRLLKAADRDPSHLIGVLTANNDTRERYRERLASLEVTLDNGRPRLLTYSAGGVSDLQFSKGGICVINGQSAKGLEFHTVFLADIDEYYCPSGNQAQREALMRRFYVMVSRACERTILLRRAGRDCPADAIIPQDDDILKRWKG